MVVCLIELVTPVKLLGDGRLICRRSPAYDAESDVVFCFVKLYMYNDLEGNLIARNVLKVMMNLSLAGRRLESNSTTRFSLMQFMA